MENVKTADAVAARFLSVHFPFPIFHFPSLVLLTIVLAIVGCGRKAAVSSEKSPPRAVATTQPVEPKALLSLKQIEPAPQFPVTLPATNPTSTAPLEAVELYAQARRAMIENRRYTAINLLDKAIALDPYSFELYFALGEAHLGRASSNDDSLNAFEKAAAIRPDDLDVQVQLGRQYLAKGEHDLALRHLRLAQKTSEYGTDEEVSAVADFFLARALQQQGYTTAAIEKLQSLQRRLRRPSFGIRANPELAYLAMRPEVLQAQIGELQEKIGDFEAAHASFRTAAEEAPDSFELQARVVRSLVNLGQDDRAVARAAEIVRRFRANVDSLNLLRDVYQQIGREKEVVRELRRLHEERPEDRSILFALADAYGNEGRYDQAQAVLQDAIGRTDYNLDVVKRLFHLYDLRDQTTEAATLLVNALAADPNLLREISPLWADLLRPSRKNRLRLADLQALEVPTEAQAAKLFWISRVAEIWQRDMLARNTLEQSAKFSPPFPPAYRMLLAETWSRDDWDEQQKADASIALQQKASFAGNPGLAAELRGLAHLRQDEPDRAVDAFAEAAKFPNPSPDLQLLYASALKEQGNNAKAEQVLWKLVSDHPACGDAYAALFWHYVEQQSIEQARKVLETWLAADPWSVDARLFEARILARSRQTQAAERILRKLFEEDSDHADVLITLRQLYAETKRTGEFIDLLEKQRVREPQNRVVVEHLIDIYTEQHQPSEALRVLDAAREAVAEDPDLLYYIAHLYTRVGQKESTERILQEVVRLDPKHAPASNDLGYFWADEGKNLDRAESLVRVAVEAEPDNQSYLDSLGWVLYKRGEFAEAKDYLLRAIGPAKLPYPVVLDHLGDVHYRLGDTAEATRQWRRSMGRLEQMKNTDREDLKTLRLTLDKKLEQAEKGEPVNVAPIVEGSATPVQAKN